MKPPATTGVRLAETRSVRLPSAVSGHIEVLIDDAAPADGASETTALVLLPSSLRDSRDLGALAAYLADAGWRVLRPQPPGMGGSSAPTDGLTLHDLARDVARTIAALGGGRAIVAGHAWGHYVARVTDLEHPHCVRGVVVMAGAARSFPPGLSDTLDLAADAAQPSGLSRGQRMAALERAFFAPGHDASPWLEGWYPQWRELYRRASQQPDKQLWWSVSHSPLLDLQGACDPWRPESTREELRALLGDQLTVQVIPQASHALPFEQPAAVAEAILVWACRLPP